MTDRLNVGGMRCSKLAGLEPLRDGALDLGGAGQVMGEQLRLALDEIGEMLFQRRPDARVQFLPSSAQQGAVGGVLHQSA